MSPVKLSARVATLQPSATLAMVARVKELKAEGVEVLDLTAGEPDFGPPSCAEAAAKDAINAGLGRYTAAAGLPELREAAAGLAKETTGLNWSADQLLVTTGAKLGICQALMALVENGDEVLFPVPCWTSYPEMVQLAGGVPVPVQCGEDHLPSVEDLAAATSERSKVLLINTPCNPTGAVYPKALLEEIGKWALKNGIAIISDEIYAAMTFGGAKHVSPIAVLPELREQSIWVGGMSKAFAMTGWRMGFLGGSSSIITKLAGLQSQLASSPPAISQYASIAALRDGTEDCLKMHSAFEKRCDLVSKALATMPGVDCPQPQGAFYAFPGFGYFLGKTDSETGKQIQSGDDLAELLLEADRIAVIGGSAFGKPDAIRLSFATSESVLQTALERLAARLNKLS
ncbi:MAG: pyridoxal phosphate-dependent aminotransferase [Planctomycetota bacterium]|nr:pyridoxal phosphate-dependent aminotransferase [Planctomycetota bacterium]